MGELFREYADWLGLDLSFQGFKAELAALPGKYAQPVGELFLAKQEDGSPIGCVAVAPFAKPGACELKRLYVRDSARGHGVGRALVEAAITFAAEAGYSEMLLDSLPRMAGALALYRAMGFEPIPPYYRNPIAGAMFFSKRLRPAGIGEVMRELIAREPIFHRPEWGTTRADFERMTAPEFWEIGASGKMYDRVLVLDLLEERHATPQVEDFQASNFRIRELAGGFYLLHYDLVQGLRRTRRTTLWQRTEEGWKIAFHQGTIVEGSE